MIRIIGIDPGLAAAGYGIIDYSRAKVHYITHGVIKTSPGEAAEKRLSFIYDSLFSVMEEFKPQEAGIETLYFAKNVKSAMPVAEARGVLVLALASKCLHVGHYTPLQIKQAVVGHGRADKNQVQEMVRIMLGLKEIPRPDHAADALAAAICHAHSRSLI